MTDLQRQQVKTLIPDLLPPDHISLNLKRIRFIQGHGVVLYDDTYAVEVYAPRNRIGQAAFFGVQRHNGKINELHDYYRRPNVWHIGDSRVNQEMKKQFDEALFHFQPTSLSRSNDSWIMPLKSKLGKKSKTIEVYMNNNLSGAA